MNTKTEHAPKETATAATAAETFIQPKITGYRQLSTEDASLINAVKAMGPTLEQLLAAAFIRASQQRKAAFDAGDEVESKRLATAEPERWVELARVDLQRGLMSLTRAVAQPSGF